MTNAQAFKDYFDKVEAYLKEDAASKNQKIPQTFRQGVSEDRGVLFGAAHFKYLVFGRGPGKFPPPDAMLAHVDKNPRILEDAKRIWKHITAKGLAYIIGRKIATEGTAIFKGDKPGIDFVGAIEKNKPDLLKSIARNQAISIRTIIHNAVRMVVCFLLSSCIYCNAQPGDPSGDPDLIEHSTPGDPSGDPDLILNSFPSELVCDSIVTIDRGGKKYLVIFYKKKKVAVYRKEDRIKAGQKGNAEFY